jgi:hypothetical protein
MVGTTYFVETQLRVKNEFSLIGNFSFAHVTCLTFWWEMQIAQESTCSFSFGLVVNVCRIQGLNLGC